MIQFPKTRDDWIIATISALTGFFFGGAAIAFVQKWLRKFI